MVYQRQFEPVVALTPVKHINYTDGIESQIEEVAAHFIRQFGLDKEKERFIEYMVTTMPNSTDRVMHVDDLSAITHIEKFKNVATYCSRAFTRAREGDIVLATLAVIPGYHDYMGKRLKLGNAAYIRLNTKNITFLWSLFEALKTDNQSLELICEFVTKNQQLVIHPYLSSIGAWQIAELLSERISNPVRVLAPLPTVALLANNKNHFLSVCAAICGKDHCITWNVVSNKDEIYKKLLEFSNDFDVVVLRYPSSATGVATELLKSEDIQQWKGINLKTFIDGWLEDHGWDEADPEQLQVSGWEPNVLASPSAQLWLPPENDGPPIVEEILDQLFVPGDPTTFNGSRVSQLPKEIVEEVKRVSFMVGHVLQKMGYVGRCSFDLLVSGPSLDTDWKVKFVECNGRWGGGSTPMTLMNRLFVDHRDKPYLHRVVTHPKLVGVSFPRFVEIFDDVLYNAVDQKGWAVVYNLAMFESGGQVDIIAVGDTFEEARERHESFLKLIDERLD